MPIMCDHIFVLLFLTIFILINQAHSYVDLFLNSNDTSSLIGFPGSFFYIFNGELRQNSISHVLEIPISKNELELNWKVNGPDQLNVNYDLEFISKSNLLNNFLTINSNGYVPHTLSKFQLLFNCTHMATTESIEEDDHFDLSLNISFKLNNTRLLLELQLVPPPPINLNIQFKKFCLNATIIRRKIALSYAQPNSNSFTIAYIIIGTLVGFLAIILFVAISMYISSKYKLKKINTKYETMQHLRNKIKTKQAKPNLKQNKVIVVSTETAANSNRSYTTNNTSMYAKNANINNSVSMKKTSRRQLNQSERQKSFVSNANMDDSNPNIYESVQDASMSLINNNQTQNQQLIETNVKEMSARVIPSSRSHKHAKQMLNVTTNTMQSAVFRETYSTNTTINQKISNSDMCDKFGKDLIDIGEVIMKGTFSQIHLGTLKQQQDDGLCENFRILIKTVKENASSEQIDIMVKESCVYRNLKHKNLFTLTGLCLEIDKKPLILYPYPEIGNLKKYLVSLKDASNSKTKNNEIIDNVSLNSNATSNLKEQVLISTQEILFLVLQILKGVNYLHSKHIVHKDIATRNCWLDTNFSLKLGDSSLSKDMFPDDYACLANNSNKPIKWMSLESIENNIYNVRTDIWEAGVVIWECFMLSAQPYDTIDPLELTDYLNESELNRLEKPPNCPSQLYEIYVKCWNSIASERPTLKELFYSIHRFYTNLNNYV